MRRQEGFESVSSEHPIMEGRLGRSGLSQQRWKVQLLRQVLVGREFGCQLNAHCRCERHDPLRCLLGTVLGPTHRRISEVEGCDGVQARIHSFWSDIHACDRTIYISFWVLPSRFPRRNTSFSVAPNARILHDWKAWRLKTTFQAHEQPPFKSHRFLPYGPMRTRSEDAVSVL